VPPIPGIFTENKVPMKMADWVLVINLIKEKKMKIS
jgi:hypothetical protein